MIRIIDGRDTGKTRTLLQECSIDGGVFICKHPTRVVNKCSEYGIDFSNIYPVGYDEALKYLKKKSNVNIYIDEIEEFLKYIMPENLIKGYTLTNED